jgi:uncharacterized protein YkwD
MNRVGRAMRGGLLATLLGAAACAHSGAAAGHAPASTATGPAAPPAPPPSSGAPAAKAAVPRPQPLVPSGAAATVYASTEPPDGAKAPADPLRDAIRAAVREGARKAGIRTPEVDGRLDLAMNDLARALGPDDLPASEAVDFLLAHYGLPDPPPEWLIQRATLGSDGEFAEQIAPQVLETLKAKQGARLGIGVDRSSGELSVVIGVQAREVDLDAMPRRIRPQKPVTVAGRLRASFHDPELVVTTPDGRVREEAVRTAPGARRFEGTIACDAGAGRYQVAVTADGAGGLGVLANFPIYCGVAPPRHAPVPAGVLPTQTTAREAEARLLVLVNRDRAIAGLPPLALDARLAEAARAHSLDMADHEFVAHISPTTGSGAERVERVGLAPDLLLENVGRAYSAEDAESGFMASPGHRSNILDRNARFIGIGVAAGREVAGFIPLFVTQLMM